MQKRSFILIALSLVLMLTVVFSSFAFAKNETKVKVNGEIITFNKALFAEKGRILVPADGVFEKMGAEVKWDKNKNTVLIEDEYTKVELTVGKKTAYIYRKYDFTGIAENVTLDIAPKEIKGAVYVPVRFVAESLGAKVSWDKKTRTVVIDTSGKITPAERPAAYKVLTAEDIKDSRELANWYNDNYKKEGIHFKTVNNITYVLAAAGEKPTGGYAIDIESTTVVAPGSVYVTAKVTKPAPDMMVTQVLTYPNVLIRLEEKGIEKVDGIVNVYSSDFSEKDLPFTIIGREDIRDNSELIKWYDENMKVKGIHYKRINDSIYVLVGAGEKATGGYAVTIGNVVTRKADEAYVYAMVEGPGPDDMVIEVITYPNVLLKIDDVNIKHVGGEIKDDTVVKRTIKDIGEAISAKDVKKIELFNFDQEKIKAYGKRDILRLVRYYNNSVVSEDPAIMMITGNKMVITLDNGTGITFTSYGSKTNVLANVGTGEEYKTYHLICPEIAEILLAQE